jgi:hypothetical protein
MTPDESNVESCPSRIKISLRVEDQSLYDLKDFVIDNTIFPNSATDDVGQVLRNGQRKSDESGVVDTRRSREAEI